MSIDVNDVMLRTDWQQLNEQKAWLLETSENEICEGLVNWIDAIQDAVVASGLIEGATVYWEAENEVADA